MKAEIVIVGAGVLGTSAAYHLARRGCRDIVVLDRAPDFGGGSTAKATGGFRAQFDNETEVRLSMLSREKLLAFEEETGVDSGYRQRGYLFLACDDAELDALRDAQRVQHASGLAEARMVTADEARALCPAIADARVIGGAFCPTDGFLRPMNVLRGYAEAAQRLGVRFEFGADTSLEHDARIVVNARGAWCGMPVTPLRRNVAATIATDALPESTPMTIWSGDWFHFRVRDGRVLLLWPDDPVVDDWLERVQEMTRTRVPSLAELPIEETWSGFYEMTPDGRALLGHIRDNLYILGGCSGHGVMHAPALGQLFAELIVDGKTSLDVSALDPHRFDSVNPSS
ncbi:MAG TPA: FAD-dependent oxidoreductase [Thermoanaerobaculia bacterium]|nr:FAD-dependent oxidoreductase [Thermoanaerobaculia bacterium]